MKRTTRFGGLQLSDEDRTQLRAQAAGSTRELLTARQWKRIRTLLLLDEGNSVRTTAAAVGGFPREASRVGKRYLSGGLKHALSDDPRPHPDKKLPSIEEGPAARKILRHLGLPDALPVLTAARIDQHDLWPTGPPPDDGCDPPHVDDVQRSPSDHAA